MEACAAKPRGADPGEPGPADLGDDLLAPRLPVPEGRILPLPAELPQELGPRQRQQVPGPVGAEGRHQLHGADLRDAEEAFDVAAREELAGQGMSQIWNRNRGRPGERGFEDRGAPSSCTATSSPGVQRRTPPRVCGVQRPDQGERPSEKDRFRRNAQSCTKKNPHTTESKETNRRVHSNRGMVSRSAMPLPRVFLAFLLLAAAGSCFLTLPAEATELPFADLVDTAARRHGVDPDLVHAVIAVESGYRASAQSRAGAQGLMQLMPGTQRDLGVSDAFDPRQNVDAGVAYLRRLTDEFGTVLALAAYNAGPGTVRRYNGIPPYEETRAYVRAVLARGRPAAGGHGAPPDVLLRRDGRGDHEAAAGVGRGLQPPAAAAGRQGVSNERQIRVGGARPPQAPADASPLVLPAAAVRLTMVDAQMDCSSPVLPALAAIQALELGGARRTPDRASSGRRDPAAGPDRRAWACLLPDAGEARRGHDDAKWNVGAAAAAELEELLVRRWAERGSVGWLGACAGVSMKVFEIVFKGGEHREVIADRMIQDHRRQQYRFYSADNEVLTIFDLSVVKEVVERKGS